MKPINDLIADLREAEKTVNINMKKLIHETLDVLEAKKEKPEMKHEGKIGNHNYCFSSAEKAKWITKK